MLCPVPRWPHKGRGPVGTRLEVSGSRAVMGECSSVLCPESVGGEKPGGAAGGSEDASDSSFTLAPRGRAGRAAQVPPAVTWEKRLTSRKRGERTPSRVHVVTLPYVVCLVFDVNGLFLQLRQRSPRGLEQAWSHRVSCVVGLCPVRRRGRRCGRRREHAGGAQEFRRSQPPGGAGPRHPAAAGLLPRPR